MLTILIFYYYYYHCIVNVLVHWWFCRCIDTCMVRWGCRLCPPRIERDAMDCRPHGDAFQLFAVTMSWAKVFGKWQCMFCKINVCRGYILMDCACAYLMLLLLILWCVAGILLHCHDSIWNLHPQWCSFYCSITSHHDVVFAKGGVCQQIDCNWF